MSMIVNATNIKTAIRNLGTSSSAMATSLRRKRITGDINSANRNPVAAFLRRHFKTTGVMVTTDTVTIGDVSISTPRYLTTFINDFNNGEYRNIVRRHTSSN